MWVHVSVKKNESGCWDGLHNNWGAMWWLRMWLGPFWFGLMSMCLIRQLRWNICIYNRKGGRQQFLEVSGYHRYLGVERNRVLGLIVSGWHILVSSMNEGSVVLTGPLDVWKIRGHVQCIYSWKCWRYDCGNTTWRWCLSIMYCSNLWWICTGIGHWYRG